MEAKKRRKRKKLNPQIRKFGKTGFLLRILERNATCGKKENSHYALLRQSRLGFRRNFHTYKIDPTFLSVIQFFLISIKFNFKSQN